MNALVQHSRRQHGLGAAELYVAIHGDPDLCHCGSTTEFVSFLDGFEKSCKACLRESGSQSTRGRRISEANAGKSYITPEGRQRLSESRRGKPTTLGRQSPVKGITKQNDENIVKRCEKISRTLRARYANPETPHWIKGLRKETDSRVARIAETHRHRFKSGAKIWCEGLTKDTDTRLAKISIERTLSQSDAALRCQSLGFDLNSQYVGQLEALSVTCRSCGSSDNRSLYSLTRSKRCKVCQPTASGWQVEIFNWVKSVYPEAVLDDRVTIHPLEIDVLLPLARLGIECNGLYWHSGTDRPWYHEFKSRKAREAGVNILHIFEDEWREKREIVCSMIKSKLGLNRRVGARTLEMRVVDRKESKAFFDQNHLDGDTKSRITLGLYEGKQLLAAMSLRRPFHRKWSGYLEIARFATRRGITVAGGLSRLTKWAYSLSKEQSAIGLMSYFDTRLGGDGSSYTSSGWLNKGETGVRFWWTDCTVRWDRFKFRAAGVISEKDVAERAGVKKIYGCRNIIMVYEGVTK